MFKKILTNNKINVNRRSFFTKTAGSLTIAASESRHFGLLLLLRVPVTAVRLTGLVGLDVAAAADQVTGATCTGGRRTGVQIFATYRRRRRRFDGRDRILRRQREQRFRGLGRPPDPAAAAVVRVPVMMMMMMMMLMINVVTAAVVMAPAVAVMVMTVVMAVVTVVVVFGSAVTAAVTGGFDVFQLQVNHVLLSPAVADGNLLVAVQVLVTEPVTAKRLGRQVVPRFHRFHGGETAAAVPPPSPVRGRRLRLDRVLTGCAPGRRSRASHRVTVLLLVVLVLLVPVQRVRAQRSRVRSRPVLRQAVRRRRPAGRGRRALADPLVRRVPVVRQFCITALMPLFRIVPRRVPPLFMSLPAVRALRLALCKKQ